MGHIFRSNTSDDDTYWLQNSRCSTAAGAGFEEDALSGEDFIKKHRVALCDSALPFVFDNQTDCRLCLSPISYCHKMNLSPALSLYSLRVFRISWTRLSCRTRNLKLLRFSTNSATNHSIKHQLPQLLLKLRNGLEQSFHVVKGTTKLSTLFVAWRIKDKPSPCPLIQVCNLLSTQIRPLMIQ